MKKAPKAEKMLSVQDIVARMAVSESTVRTWLTAGRFPGAWLERPPVGVPYWQIPESAIEKFARPEMGRPPKKKREEPSTAKQKRR